MNGFDNDIQAAFDEVAKDRQRIRELDQKIRETDKDADLEIGFVLGALGAFGVMMIGYGVLEIIRYSIEND